jgi:hypothetical protein
MSERAEPMQYAGCYNLRLYCRNFRGEVRVTLSSPDGIHAWDAHTAEFTGETFRDCARQARIHGWRVHTTTRTATCPHCASLEKIAGKNNIMTNKQKFDEVQAAMRQHGLEIRRNGGKIIIQTPAQQVEVDDLDTALVYLRHWLTLPR